MNFSDTRLNHGGLMRCCIATLCDQNPDSEVREGEVLDCKYEKPGNRRMICLGGVWQWNKPENLATVHSTGEGL